MSRRTRLHVSSLERRLVPAELLHTLLPDSTGPQIDAELGYAVAAGTNYFVVGAPSVNTLGYESTGQVLVYDANTHNVVASLFNPTPAPGDRFGNSVALSGSIVVVGAPFDDTGAKNAGSVYVFDLNSVTPTTPIATLINPTPASNDQYGNSVAVSGAIVVVGAYLDDAAGFDAGSAYVYDVNSISPNVPIATLNSPTSGDEGNFGFSVAMTGNHIVVGTPGAETEAVFVFDMNSLSPTAPIASLINPTPNSNTDFGASISMSDTKVVVGAPAFGPGSAYVFDLNSPTPTVLIAKLNNPSSPNNDQFGNSVSLSGSIVIVGARAYAFSDYGAAYVFDLNSVNPTTPIATLNNPLPKGHEYFGNSVAMSGSILLVGANLADIGEVDSGAAYLYDLNSMTPSAPIALLSNPTTAINDRFGDSVAVSETIVVVGASLEDTGEVDSGLAYVYDLNSTTPLVPIIILTNPIPTGAGLFGRSVAISGTIVVVGVPGNGQPEGGIAFVFDLNSMTPTAPIATLNNPTPASYDGFGCSVAVSGTIVVVGAYWDDTGAKDSGSAYVYDLSSTTPTLPIATLNNPTPTTSDIFGISVAVSQSTVVVGAPSDDTGAANAGSAYVYDLSSLTPTVPIATLNNPNPASNDVFGYSVAVSGMKVVIGAYQDDFGAIDAGSAFVYDLSSMTPAVPTITLNNPTPANADRFGFSLAMSGSTVAIGAYFDDIGASNSGTAYVYDLNSFTPTVPFATLYNPNPAAEDNFGSSIALSGTTVAVGADVDDDQNTDQGSARVYTLAPARVIDIDINEGAAQRSRVTSVAITFDQPITFTGSPASAFELKRQLDNIPVPLAATVTGNTVKLTFFGGTTEFSSLADGLYTLTIDASKVANTNGKLDGNGDGIPGDNYQLIGTPANGLFRLFGDSDGNGSVSASDFNAFRLVYGTSGPSFFDFDNDGQVSAADFNQFRTRYGVMVGP